MSQIKWANDASGDFANGADWTGGKVPGASDDALLTASGLTAYTVTSSADETVSSIQLATTATLAITGGTFTAANGTGSGANAGTITVGESTVFAIAGGFKNAGVIALTSSGNYTTLAIAKSTTLSGKGRVTLKDTPYSRILGGASATTLTNVDNTISGAGTIGSASLTLVNQAAGVVDATGTANALTLSTGANAIANTGLIEATGAAGLTIFNSTVHNAGGVILANGANVSLQGADVVGGTVKSAGKGVVSLANAVFDGSTGTFGAVTNQALVDVNESTTLSLEGSIANSGVIALTGTGNSATLSIAKNTTLSGKGQVTLKDTSYNQIVGVASSILTNVDNLISGAGRIDSTNFVLVNQTQGIIEATGANALVLTGGNAFLNAGVLFAGGIGGLTLLNATVEGQTVGGVTGALLAGNGSNFSLQGADIVGGVLKATGSGVFTEAASSILDGTTIGFGAMINQALVNVNESTTLSLEGSIVNSGVIALTGSGNYTTLAIAKSASLSGKGRVTLKDTPYNQILGAASATTLTNVDNTISGAGMIGSANLTFVNQAAGVVDATGTNNALMLGAGANVIANAGLIEATGAAGLTIASPVTNTGKLEGVGAGALTIQSAAVTGGAGGVVTALKGGLVSLRSGTITGGAISILAGGLLSADSGASVLAAASFANAGTVTIHDNTSLTISGTVSNSGVITVTTASNPTVLIVGASGLTLSGAGKLTLTDNNPNQVIGAKSGATLTNSDNTISGAGQLGAGQMTLVNQAKGIVDATGGNALVLSTGAGSIVNAGLIEATGTGGLTLLASTVDNAGGVILANGANVNLQGATIAGGTLKAAGAGVVAVASAAIFDGSTANGAVANVGLVRVNDSTILSLEGSIANSGTIALVSGGNATILSIAKNTTLSGKGHVTLNDNGANRIVGVASATLTNVDNTISGDGTIDTTNLILANQTKGVVDASSGAGALVLSGKTAIANAGLLEATGPSGLTILNATVDNLTVGGFEGTILAGDKSNVSLQGADIVGGFLLTAGTGAITVASTAIFDGTTKAFGAVINQGLVRVNDSQTLSLEGSIANSGTIALVSGGNPTTLSIAKNTTLSGGGHVTLNDNGANRIVGVAPGTTLTNVDNTLSGAGTIDSTNLVFVNKSIVDAAGANALVLTGKNAFANQGQIVATGAGGLTILNATVDNYTIGFVISGLDADGANISLQGAGIVGGYLTSFGGGAVVVASNSMFDGTTATFGVVANFGLVRVNDSQTLSLEGSIANSGTIALASGGNATSLAIAKNTTLISKGHVTLDDSGANRIVGGASATTLTNVDNTIAGAGTIDSTTLLFVNQAKGIVDATGGAALVLTGKNAFANAGLIEATGPGGIAVVGSTVNNAGGMISANGGDVSLNGGTIVGGILSTGGSSVFRTLSGGAGRLDGVTNQGTVDIVDSSKLFVHGAIANSGVIALQSGGNPTDLVIDAGGAAFSGAGEILMDDNAANLIIGATASMILTNASLITGGGDIGGGTMTLVNQASGVIHSGTGSTTLIIDTGKNAITNAGLIEALGPGGLVIKSQVANSGTLAAGAGSVLTLGEAVSNGTAGVITAAAGGTVDLQGIAVSAGTLAGAGLIQTTSGATLFDGTSSTLNNQAGVQVNDNTSLALQGVIHNTGLITLAGTANVTSLAITDNNATLTGGGTIALGDSLKNAITGLSDASTLTNVDNTISGSGFIGLDSMTLVNQAKGVIEGVGAQSLAVGTGANVIVNAGLIEGAGTAATLITSNVVNTGTLEGATAASLDLNKIGVDNYGGLILAAAGGVVTLDGATINGGTLQTAGNGEILIGLGGAALNAIKSAVSNLGHVVVQDNANLSIQGPIHNSGAMFLQSTGDVTRIVVQRYTALNGAGAIVLSDNGANLITGFDSGFNTLVNIDNTILGAGQIGPGIAAQSMILINQAAGVIDGNGANALVLDTGANEIFNAGLIESTGAGGVTIQGFLDNHGTLDANGGTFAVLGALTGGGVAKITSGILDLTAANITMAVTFYGSSGALKLDNSQSYTGKISGFSKTGGTSFDLTDIGFVSPGEATYVDNGSKTGGMLTVTDGKHTAHINLVGDYTGSTWTASSDGAGGVTIVDPVKHALPPQPAAHFVAAMAGFAARSDAPAHAAVAGAAAAHHLFLAAPRTGWVT